MLTTQSAGISPAPDSSGLIRFPAVKELTGLSRSTIDRLERAGTFPRRVILSSNAIGWHRAQVLAWTQSRRVRS
ncbi:MAG TPA: AlpA family phage regulatory protein [Candidatus Competibacter sp.]|jgi:prophage regulatory protein|nr:AlpA family phage regulatory protein [Candidatus Contendobacter sp.]HRX61381.1 AlpA family phage regulatory protein [Candidatus Competibacter sp.]